MKKTIYIIASLVIVGGVIWYFMRAQNQSAAINAGSGTPPAGPAADGPAAT